MINERKSQFSTDSLSKRTERPKPEHQLTEEQIGSCESKIGNFSLSFSRKASNLPADSMTMTEISQAPHLDAASKLPNSMRFFSSA